MKITLTELKAIIEEELELYLAEAKAKVKVQRSPEAGKPTNKNAMGKPKLEGKPLNKTDDKEEGKLANVAKPSTGLGTGLSKAEGKAKPKGLAAEEGKPGKDGKSSPTTVKKVPSGTVSKKK